MKTTKAVDSTRTSKTPVKRPPKAKVLVLPKAPQETIAVEIPELKVYGREELVRMITQVSDPARHWTEIGRNDPVKIDQEAMYRLHAVIATFRANRIQYDRGSFDYYKESFDAIDEAIMNRNFEAFKAGCESLIRDISWD